MTRFQALRPLATGGMGAVELVFDDLRGQAVARKRAHFADPDAMLAFKREFRQIEHLSHPGLVRLYELGEDVDGLYYTMEHVEGSDLLTSCRGSKTLADEETDVSAARKVDTDVATAQQRLARSAAEGTLPPPPPPPSPSLLLEPAEFDLDLLASSLPQIIETLMFLHAHDVIHRDLKPSNVLVREDGVVKLLDFGILGHVRHADPDQGKIVGTVGYMSPEQIRGDQPTVAIDTYALGAMLFEIVTGRRVFKGPPREVMEAHLTWVPPDVEQLVTGVPQPVCEAISAMLRKDPTTRPTLKQLARTLLPGIGARAPIRVLPSLPLPEIEGRLKERRLLEETIEATLHGDGFNCLVLAGAAGSGKSTLASWTALRAERIGPIVLRGGPTTRQQVAFNAMDGVIDALALELNRRDRAGLEAWMATAAHSFPVLAPPGEPPAGESLPREAIFEALGGLFGALAREAGGLVLLVDDLHAADIDSLDLLDYLVETAPPQVFVLGTVRSDVDVSLASHWLARRGGEDRVQLVPLGRLPKAALEAIIRRLARKGGADAEADSVAKVAATCDGSPLLAQLAGAALAKTGAGHEGLVPSLAAIIVRTSRGTQGVLAALAEIGGGGPARIAELARATGYPPGAVADGVREAARVGLVRCTEPLDPSSEIAFHHELIRLAAREAAEADGPSP